MVKGDRILIERTCCFTGHRKLPAKKIDTIVFNLNKEIERLIKEGVTTFLSGGALGFDQIAASLIATKKEMGYNIRLVMALPCRGQDDLWTAKEKQLYNLEEIMPKVAAFKISPPWRMPYGIMVQVMCQKIVKTHQFVIHML